MAKKTSKGYMRLSEDTREVLAIATRLANYLQEEASIALPTLKTRGWSHDEIINMCLRDWVTQAKRVHVTASRKLEKELFGKLTAKRDKA